ncbi:hypothetical protein [uncultured Methylobacterium sp.]|uniref:hypothetical protein n=1 Tax=uncultured Methylobacterium sp. TaxID=157278 RepID=UPI0035CC1943
MTKTHSAMLATLGLLFCIGSASAAPSCLEAQSTVDAATALRHQARREFRRGNHDRACDILDEVGDRYGEARDAFADCAAGVIAIDLRTELRALRIAKHVDRCD